MKICHNLASAVWLDV